MTQFFLYQSLLVWKDQKSLWKQIYTTYFIYQVLALSHQCDCVSTKITYITEECFETSVFQPNFDQSVLGWRGLKVLWIQSIQFWRIDTFWYNHSFAVMTVNWFELVSKVRDVACGPLVKCHLGHSIGWHIPVGWHLSSCISHCL